MGTRVSNGRPDLTTVIPTVGTRPEFLRRAILSCLQSGPSENVEVIVVVNGPDVSHCSVTDDRIRCVHLAERNGNKARSAGLAAATGRYVRFLDDDDFLFPENAARQYKELVKEGADISTGGICFVNEKLKEIGHYVPNEGNDFVAEIFRQRPSTLPHAHLYNRDLIYGLTWNPQRHYLQDVDWIHQLMRRGEVRWLPCRYDVGAWRCHREERISINSARELGEMHLLMGVEIVCESVRVLEENGRLDHARRHAAAKAIWDYAHHGFSWAPFRWTRIAQLALTLDPMSRSSSKFMNYPVVRWINPITAEWIFFPVRAALRKWGVTGAP